MADFIACVAWRQTADYVTKYLHKGDMVAVCGALQNRQYQAQDGSTRYVTEIVVDEVQSCSNARSDAQNANVNDFTEVDDDNLPF